jgi:hypothetical protein
MAEATESAHHGRNIMDANELRALQAPLKKRYREEPGTALTPARAEAMPDVRSPRYLYAGGGTKPPISAASNRANSIVVGSSPSGPMIRPTGNPSPVKPIGAAVAGRYSKRLKSRRWD